jgi:predicted DNA-binding transcriptional regulator YafY
MISLTKAEKQKLKEVLKRSKDKEARAILNKFDNDKKLTYTDDKDEIRLLLIKAHKEKRKVKIRYYSLSSDEVKWRKVAIYKSSSNFIIAFCYLRNEERTFVTDRISRAAILDERYKIPKGWKSSCNVYSR